MAKKDDFGVKSAEIFRQEMPDGTVRALFVTGAYDLREAPDGKNYGQHGTDWLFVLSRGDNAAVALKWMFPFRLKHCRSKSEYEFDGLGSVSFHSSVQVLEDAPEAEACKWLGGKLCWSWSTGLLAGELFDDFVADPNVLWQKLEELLVMLEKKIEIEKKEIRDGG